MLIQVELLVVYEVCCDFQRLQLRHLLEIDSLEVVRRQLKNKVLQVHELTEEVALVDEAAGPLQVQDADTLADRKVAAVSEQQC